MRNRKSLDVQRNEAARNYVRRVVATDFEGNVSAAAVAFDVSQSTLSDFLNGNRGAGLSLLDGVATYKSVSLDVVLGRAPEPNPNDPYPCKRLVIASREFQTANERVQRAFLDLEVEGGDQSVVAWSKDLLALMEAERLGQLRARQGQRLLPDDAEHEQDGRITVSPPKS